MMVQSMTNYLFLAIAVYIQWDIEAQYSIARELAIVLVAWFISTQLLLYI